MWFSYQSIAQSLLYDSIYTHLKIITEDCGFNKARKKSFKNFFCIHLLGNERQYDIKRELVDIFNRIEKINEKADKTFISFAYVIYLCMF